MLAWIFDECREGQINLIDCHRITRYNDIKIKKEGVAGALLNYVCEDMRDKGIATLYLVTDRTSFYECCGGKLVTVSK